MTWLSTNTQGIIRIFSSERGFSSKMTGAYTIYGKGDIR